MASFHFPAADSAANDPGELHRSEVRRIGLWALLVLGAIMFPVGAMLVPVELLPLPRIRSAPTGMAVSLVWLLGFIAMTFAMVSLRGARLRHVALMQLLLGAIVVLSPAMPSTDNYMYLAFGDMLRHGGNPWHPARMDTSSAVMNAAAVAWGNPPVSSRYGPLFVAGEAALLSAFQGFDVRALLIVQRLASLLCAVAITLVIRGPSIRYWALNPFVAFYFALEAHNDVFFILLLACSARIRSPFLKGVFIGAGGMVKIVALALLGFLRPAQLRQAALGAALAVLIALIAIRHALDPSAIVGQAHSIGNSPTAIFDALLLQAKLSRAVAGVAAVAISICVVAAVALRYRWRRRDALVVASVFAILVLPQIWPWYFAWPLAAAVATARRVVRTGAVAIAAASVLLEIPQFGFPSSGVLTTSLFLVAFVSIGINTTMRAATIRSRSTSLRKGEALT